MRNVSYKLKRLSEALKSEGLIAESKKIESFVKAAGIVDSAPAIAGGAVAGAAAAIGGSAAAGAIGGASSAAIGGSAAAGAIGGASSWAAVGSCTLLTGGWCGVVIAAAAALGGGLVYDWYNDNRNLIERFGGSDSDSIEQLFAKWVMYTAEFDMIRGHGSFPKIDPNYNIGGGVHPETGEVLPGVRTRAVETFFQRFRDALDNNQTVSEATLEGWIKTDHAGVGETLYGTWGLDDEVYFVNSFNMIVEGKIALEEEIAKASEEAADEEAAAPAAVAQWTVGQKINDPDGEENAWRVDTVSSDGQSITKATWRPDADNVEVTDSSVLSKLKPSQVASGPVSTGPVYTSF